MVIFLLVVYVLIFVPIGFGVVALGVTGFSQAGFKFAGRRRVTGRAGVIAGTACIIFGFLLCWPLVLGVLGALF